MVSFKKISKISPSIKFFCKNNSFLNTLRMSVCEGFAFFCKPTRVCIHKICLLLIFAKLHSRKIIFAVFIQCRFSFSIVFPILKDIANACLVLAKMNSREIIIIIYEYLYLHKLIYGRLISNRIIFAKIVILRQQYSRKKYTENSDRPKAIIENLLNIE